MNKLKFKARNIVTRLANMKQRCYNQNNPSYQYYGGRGITICDEWRYDQQKFIEWSLENGFSMHLSIDRIDNDKGYYPDNCRFVDASTQMRNKRYSTNVTGFRGVRTTSHSKSSLKPYQARVVPKFPDMTKRDKRISLGWFATPKAAATAYDDYVLKYDLPCITNGVSIV